MLLLHFSEWYRSSVNYGSPELPKHSSGPRLFVPKPCNYPTPFPPATVNCNTGLIEGFKHAIWKVTALFNERRVAWVILWNRFGAQTTG